MVTAASGSVIPGTAKPTWQFSSVRIPEQGSCAMNQVTCVGNPVSHDGQSRAGLHRKPPQEQFLHENFYLNWGMPENPSVSCCNDADCYSGRNQIRRRQLQSRRRESGKYVPVPAEMVERNRGNPEGRHHLSTHPTPCSASHWEAPHEIYPSKW